MDSFDWESRIREWSQKRIEVLTEIEKAELPTKVLESRYLGFPGATKQQIADAKIYLGVTFPPSYRGFLKASNGLLSTSEYGIRFYSTEEVEWYILGNEETVDDWMKLGKRILLQMKNI